MIVLYKAVLRSRMNDIGMNNTTIVKTIEQKLKQIIDDCALAFLLSKRLAGKEVELAWRKEYTVQR